MFTRAEVDLGRDLGLKLTPFTIVLRPRPTGQSQALVWCSDHCVYSLEGGRDGLPLVLGPQLQPELLNPQKPKVAYEPASGCVVFSDCNSVMCLGSDDKVTLVAGSRSSAGAADGDGQAARFTSIISIVADGMGAVYVAEPSSIRKVVVAGSATVAASSHGGSGAGSSSSSGVEGGASAGASGTVSTLPNSSAPGTKTWKALAFDTARNSLVAATEHAIYRIPLAPADGGSRDGGPVPMAGAEKQKPFEITGFDGIHALLATPAGELLVGDCGGVRKVDVWGNISTLVGTGFAKGEVTQLAMLPQGGLAVCDSSSSNLHLLFGPGLEATPQRHGSSCSSSSGGGGNGGANSCSTGGGGTSSPLSLGALLRRPANGGSGTLVVKVGGAEFNPHRALLCDRSDFFRHLLSGGFAEGTAEEVELGDADPEAFSLILEFMYTGALDVPPALLRPTAELAGRLLLPTASLMLQHRLLAAATPASVVSDLLWADRHNMADLVPALQACIVKHHKLVTAATPLESLRQLAESCPALMAALFKAVSEQAQ